MKNTPDPTYHRDREKQFFEHARALLEDDRLRLDTTRGIRPIGTLMPAISEGEPGVERGEKVKRLMLELGVADRSLQGKMPVGERLEVALRQKNFWMFKKKVGELVVACVSPTRALVKGESPAPLTAAVVNGFLSQRQTSSGGLDVPATIVLMSTAGYSAEARDLATRNNGRTVILIEPNDAGGWQVSGPPSASDLIDLLDPEQEESKRHRVHEYLETNKFDLQRRDRFG